MNNTAIPLTIDSDAILFDADPPKPAQSAPGKVIRLRRKSHPIVPLPKSRTAAAYVTIDGQFYAPFQDVESAKDATAMWLTFWPAVRGKEVLVRVR